MGIELANAGRLEKRGSGFYTWFKTQVPDEEVVEATHQNETTPTYWQAYTEAQIETTERLCDVLTGNYWIKDIVGHEEISPGRKVDPGPAFPLDSLKDRFFGRKDNEADEQEAAVERKKVLVAANKLNIRTGPSTSHAMAAQPLERGTIVEIADEQSGWYKVKVETEGWVNKEFITD